MKSIFRNKKIKWNTIIFTFICLVSIALFLDYVILNILNDTAFTEVAFNNFLYSFTFIINTLFIAYHLVMVFFKKKSNSMLFALASASYLVFFYIIRLCLVWY